LSGQAARATGEPATSAAATARHCRNRFSMVSSSSWKA
jgi:hypothetical protein